MGDNVPQFYCEEDGCTYYYDKYKRCYRSVCDVGGFAQLPLEVRQQIHYAKADAEETLAIPIE